MIKELITSKVFAILYFILIIFVIYSFFVFFIYTIGKRFVEAILQPKKWPSNIPQVNDKAVAILLGQQLIKAGFFHRSEKLDDKKGALQVKIYLFICI